MINSVQASELLVAQHGARDPVVLSVEQGRVSWGERASTCARVTGIFLLLLPFLLLIKSVYNTFRNACDGIKARQITQLALPRPPSPAPPDPLPSRPPPAPRDPLPPPPPSTDGSAGAAPRRPPPPPTSTDGSAGAAPRRPPPPPPRPSRPSRPPAPPPRPAPAPAPCMSADDVEIGALWQGYVDAQIKYMIAKQFFKIAQAIVNVWNESGKGQVDLLENVHEVKSSAAEATAEAEKAELARARSKPNLDSSSFWNDNPFEGKRVTEKRYRGAQEHRAFKEKCDREKQNVIMHEEVYETSLYTVECQAKQLYFEQYHQATLDAKRTGSDRVSLPVVYIKEQKDIRVALKSAAAALNLPPQIAYMLRTDVVSTIDLSRLIQTQGGRLSIDALIENLDPRRITPKRLGALSKVVNGRESARNAARKAWITKIHAAGTATINRSLAQAKLK